ncbi:hypothetical protein DSO57_1011471 [Entomophthora muscae]|uniref:Uncharacterized protein n=1 Tax=Entomophthora muscae TaxID=34485 RepID=A0ACC2RX99_9FUNG|nr:hypothetical protein DSO57_1011471 [Entomophthora muscae]
MSQCKCMCMKFLLLFSLANAYTFEYLVTHPRYNIRSFNTHERMQYFAHFKSKPTSNAINDVVYLKKLTADLLEGLPMDFEAYPAWTGMFLEYVEKFVGHPILYWDWTKSSEVWMFDPILPASFPCLRKYNSVLKKDVCTPESEYQFDKAAESVENAESVGDAGLIIASYMPKVAYHLTKDHNTLSLYRNPIIFSILAYNQVLFCRYLEKNPGWEDTIYTNSTLQSWRIPVKQAIKKTISRCHFNLK